MRPLYYAAALLTSTFLLCLFAYFFLRRRERRLELPPCAICPLCHAWAASLGLELLFLLLVSTSVVDDRYGAGEVILKVSGILFPLLTAGAWGWFRWRARQLASPKGRHAHMALWSLLLSSCALGLFLMNNGRQLGK